MGTWIEIAAADGARLSAYRSDPSGIPRGGLVVVQEIFGVNGHIRGICDGYAADGYVVLAPALFDRCERHVDLAYGPDDVARGRELRGRIALESALADIAAALAEIAGSGNVGIIGYCWGGLLAWLASAGVPGFSCAVAYYGGGMPDAVAQTPRCPVLAHFGELDAMIPVAGVQALAAAHPTAQVHLYPAGHGFNCDQRSSFDADSATLARRRTLAFLRQHVG
jgi:carboxymethylenebutenolidase